jgi:hypothetical protein
MSVFSGNRITTCPFSAETFTSTELRPNSFNRLDIISADCFNETDPTLLPIACRVMLLVLSEVFWTAEVSVIEITIEIIKYIKLFIISDIKLIE